MDHRNNEEIRFKAKENSLNASKKPVKHSKTR